MASGARRPQAQRTRMARPRLPRWGLLVAVLAVAGMLVVAWRWHAAPVADGSVLATVDGVAVTSTDVMAEAQATGLAPDRIDAAAQKALIGKVVDRRLMAAVARKRGIESDPLFRAGVARAGELLAAGTVARTLAGPSQPGSVAEARHYIAANPLRFGNRVVWTIDAVVADMRIVPPALLDSLTSVEDIAALLQRLRVPFDRVRQQLDSATLPPAVAKQIAGLAPGSLLRLPAGEKAMIGVVSGRQSRILPEAEQVEIARGAVGQMRQEQALQTALKTLREKAKIQYTESAGQ